MVQTRPLGRLPHIPEAITYLERLARGEEVEHLPNAKRIEELYLEIPVPLQDVLLTLARVWGDQPAMRQILFFHYLQKEPLLKEILHHCIYPHFNQNIYYWNEQTLKRFMTAVGLTESEQNRSLKIIEKALAEVHFLTIQGPNKYIEFQRPTLEAVVYAFYVEYGEGWPEGRRFSLMNPPLEQITEHAAFPSYFLMDPWTIATTLEACRLKNYISLEARGGLCQYALIYQDLFGLVEYMVQGGRL